MAKEKANQATCMNNLKQIGIAYAMYANDYNDFIPTSGNTMLLGGSNPTSIWYGPLGFLIQGWRAGKAKYITTPNVFFCPSPDVNLPCNNFFNWSGYGSQGLSQFYAWFEVLCPSGRGFDGSDSIGVNAYYMVDGNSTTGGGSADGPYGSGGGKLSKCQMCNYPCAADAASCLSCNHVWNSQILGFNVLYFDGSVKWWKNTNAVLADDQTGILPSSNFWWAVQQY